MHFRVATVEVCVHVGENEKPATVVRGVTGGTRLEQTAVGSPHHPHPSPIVLLAPPPTLAEFRTTPDDCMKWQKKAPPALRVKHEAAFISIENQ